MTKPRATLRCVANTCVGPDERVIEISGKNGGCLIGLLNCTDGTLLVSVYRCDKTVRVMFIILPRASPSALGGLALYYAMSVTFDVHMFGVTGAIRTIEKTLNHERAQ